MLRSLHDISTKNEFDLKQIPFEDDCDRKSVLHFDLTKDNIFINKNKISIIDFDDAKFGDSICDVAIFISNIFFSKTRGVDLDGMNIFINEYYGEDKALMSKEKSLIKKYALQWIDLVLGENRLDTSVTESLEVKRRLIEINL